MCGGCGDELVCGDEVVCGRLGEICAFVSYVGCLDIVMKRGGASVMCDDCDDDNVVALVMRQCINVVFGGYSDEIVC